MTTESSMRPFIDRVKRAYHSLGPDSPAILRALYSEDVLFIDPANTITGRDALLEHFAALCRNVTECRFEFDGERELIAEDRALLCWKMSYRHKRLNRGRLIELEGVSLLKLRERIYFHQDWFDLGGMVYEHVPMLGRMVRMIKRRL